MVRLAKSVELTLLHTVCKSNFCSYNPMRTSVPNTCFYLPKRLQWESPTPSLTSSKICVRKSRNWYRSSVRTSTRPLTYTSRLLMPLLVVLKVCLAGLGRSIDILADNCGYVCVALSLFKSLGTCNMCAFSEYLFFHSLLREKDDELVVFILRVVLIAQSSTNTESWKDLICYMLIESFPRRGHTRNSGPVKVSSEEYLPVGLFGKEYLIYVATTVCRFKRDATERGIHSFNDSIPFSK